MRHPFRKRTAAIAAGLTGFIMAMVVSSCDTKENDVSLWPYIRFSKCPYIIYDGDNTRMTVRWQLTETAHCTIEWGEAAGNYHLGTVETTESSPGDYQHMHQHTITGLSPGTRYYFRVRSTGCVRTGSFLAALAADATDLKFVAYGDSRTYTKVHERVAGAILDQWTADPAYRTFVLSMGDLVADGSQESYWSKEFFPRSMTNFRHITLSAPFLSAVGNHDLGPALTGTLFKKYFTYPYEASAGHYWSFDYGPAHFAILDGYTDLTPGSPQLVWLKADLEATTKQWNFVVTHKPGWSAYGIGGHANSTTFQDNVEPLCETYGVDIVFAGHNHYYARAEVPYGTGKIMQHVTTGGGSGPLYTPDDTQPNLVITDMSNHFCAVDIAGNTLTLKAIRDDGSEIETLVITKP